VNSTTIVVKATPWLVSTALEGFPNIPERALLQEALQRPDTNARFVTHGTWVTGGLNNCGMKLVQGLSTSGWTILFSDPRKEVLPLYKKLLGDEFPWSYEPGKINVRPRAGNKLWDAKEVTDEKRGMYAALAESTDKGPKVAGVILTDNVSRSSGDINQNSFKSSDFVKWLIRNDFGVVVLLPPALNPNHSDMGLATLIQAAYWIPPSFAKYSIKGGTKLVNKDLLQPIEDWRAAWKGKVPDHFLSSARKAFSFRNKNNDTKRNTD